MKLLNLNNKKINIYGEPKCKKIFFIKIFLFSFLFFSSQSLQAEYDFDGIYRSQFLLPFKDFYKEKCPKDLPITIELEIKKNKIKGEIYNTSICDGYQYASITGEIDISGNFIKTKFKHSSINGRREDAYKIEGNISGDLVLKSKAKFLYKNQKFSLTKSKTEKSKQTKLFKERKDKKDLDLKEFKEKQVKDQQDLEIEEFKEKQLKNLKEKQKKLKKSTNLMFN